MMLYKLLSNSDRKKFDIEVISLLGAGPIGEKIQKLGISVRYLGMRPNAPNPFAFLRLIWWLYKRSPDIVQTWMYHADFLGGVAVKLIKPSIPVIWGIRVSNLVPKLSKKRTILIAKASAFFSRWIPRKIICNAESAKIIHVSFGYQEEKMMVIPNGFDLSLFRPDDEARSSFRKEFNISEDKVIVGTVARLDPQKDYETFFCAAGIVSKNFPDIRFIACGRGVGADIIREVQDASLSERCYLLNERSDTPRVMASLDVFVLSAAYGEGFPNVIGEAMSCGIPCVVTDVGDSALVVGDTGIVVPPRNPEGLADGIQKLLSLSKEERKRLGERARERIKKNYAIERIVEMYENLYRKEI